MSASVTSLPKRLLSGVAIAALALVLAACSEEKKEAASKAPAETSASADAMTTASTTATPAASRAKPAGTEVAQAAAPAKAELPQSEGSVDVQKLMEPGALPEMALGEANAPVTIVEYMSMTCPHCANFHNKTFDAIKAK